jgi:hypothetical protein
MVREVPMTRQPRSSSVCVTPRPIPLEAPVTIATGGWVVFIDFFQECFCFQTYRVPSFYVRRFSLITRNLRLDLYQSSNKRNSGLTIFRSVWFDQPAKNISSSQELTKLTS